MKHSITLFVAIIITLIIITPFTVVNDVKAEEGDHYEGELFLPEETKLYVLENKSSGYCLNLKHGSTSNGNEVNLYPLDKDDIYTQLWQIKIEAYTEEGFPIVRIKPYYNSNKCIDIRRRGKALTDAGTQPSCVWEIEDDNHQLFILEYTSSESFRLKTYVKGYILSPRNQEEASMTQTALKVNPYTSEVLDYQVFYLRDENGLPLKDIVSDLNKANELADEVMKGISKYKLDDNAYDAVQYALKYVKLYTSLLNNATEGNLAREEVNNYIDNVCPQLITFTVQQFNRAFSMASNNTGLIGTLNEIYALLPTNDEIRDYVLSVIRETDISLYKLLTEYSDFNIVENVRSCYLMDQRDYRRFYNENNKSVGCTIISEVFAYRIKYDICADPYDTVLFRWTKGGAGNGWKSMEGIKCNTVAEYTEKVIEYLMDGTACTLRLSKQGISKHTVLAIGIKKDVTSVDDVTWKDILVFDPWGGCVKLLSDMANDYDNFSLWSIYVTK